MMSGSKISFFDTIAGSGTAWVFAVVTFGVVSTVTVDLTAAFPSDINVLPHQNSQLLPVSPLSTRHEVFFDPFLPHDKNHRTIRALSRRSPRGNSQDVNLVDPADVDDDTCDGKGDKYYPNYGSNCTSYYFCTAGFQATYLCEPGLVFNGVKCTRDYECPGGRSGTNPCAASPNGYYASARDPTKYFYCHHKSKVIELSCSGGKVYDDTLKKCERAGSDGGLHWEGSSCAGRGNGFYPDLESGCAKYYYCIDTVKTQLECPGGHVFNGDICVLEGSFKCPKKSSS